MEPKYHPEEKLRHVLGYIGQLRDALRMQNWDIILHPAHATGDGHAVAGDETDDVNACTWQAQYHRTTNIELGSDWFELSPVAQRDTLIHELIHAQHQDLTELWEGCTLNNDDVPQSQARSWDADYHRIIETFVSWITARIAEHHLEYDPKRKYPVPVGCYLLGEHRG